MFLRVYNSEMTCQDLIRNHQLQREYLERIQPYIKILADVEAVTIPNYLISERGHERLDNYSPECKKLREFALREIETIRCEIGANTAAAAPDSPISPVGHSAAASPSLDLLGPDTSGKFRLR